MGLPINRLVIATNENDILKRVVNTGKYKPLKVQQTISPSMDIQIASNFERLIFDICSCNSERTSALMTELNQKKKFDLSKEEIKKIKENFSSESLSENETKLIMGELYKKEGILIDPHTAVGVGVAKKLSLQGNTIILATAHPSKFSNAVMNATGVNPELPNSLEKILSKKEKYEKLGKDIKNIQNYILEKV